MADIVLIHGAWTGGWMWRNVQEALSAFGHFVIAPTLTGLGEREHLLTRETNLDTHIQDLMAAIQWEDLHDVFIVAHSYGGMLATALVDRLPNDVSGLVLMNAALPRDGESMLDMQTTERRDQVIRIAEDEGEGYRVPKRLLLNTGIADQDEAEAFTKRTSDHPLKAMLQPLTVGDGVASLKDKMHLIADHASQRFRSDHEWAASQPDWQTATLGVSHFPMVTVAATTSTLINTFVENNLGDSASPF